MGLTIHYRLKHSARDTTTARQVVQQLRQRALTLPFQQVGPLVELTGGACDFERGSRNDPNRWLLIQTRECVERPPYSYDVRPIHLIGFNTVPSQGSEPANFGLCRSPASIEITDRDVQPNRQRRIRTGLRGWTWRSFCKTQYASNPNYDGVGNFLRCHLLVVRMLDHAKELGVLGDVKDEADYWEKRDTAARAREVGQWNEMIAAQVGQLKDALGDGIAGEILNFPNFEHWKPLAASNNASAWVPALSHGPAGVGRAAFLDHYYYERTTPCPQQRKPQAPPFTIVKAIPRRSPISIFSGKTEVSFDFLRYCRTIPRIICQCIHLHKTPPKSASG